MRSMLGTEVLSENEKILAEMKKRLEGTYSTEWRSAAWRFIRRENPWVEERELLELVQESIQYPIYSDLRSPDSDSILTGSFNVQEVFRKEEFESEVKWDSGPIRFRYMDERFLKHTRGIKELDERKPFKVNIYKTLYAKRNNVVSQALEKLSGDTEWFRFHQIWDIISNLENLRHLLETDNWYDDPIKLGLLFPVLINGCRYHFRVYCTLAWGMVLEPAYLKSTNVRKGSLIFMPV